MRRADRLFEIIQFMRRQDYFFAWAEKISGPSELKRTISRPTGQKAHPSRVIDAGRAGAARVVVDRGQRGLAGPDGPGRDGHGRSGRLAGRLLLRGGRLQPGSAGAGRNGPGHPLGAGRSGPLPLHSGQGHQRLHHPHHGPRLGLTTRSEPDVDEPEQPRRGWRNAVATERTISAAPAVGRPPRGRRRRHHCAHPPSGPGPRPSGSGPLPGSNRLARVHLSAIRQLRGEEEGEGGLDDELLQALSAPLGDAPES